MSTLPIQPTPLLGRTHELALAWHLLVDEGIRLLTFTGPGGAGKTRLALAVAETVRHAFPDGVWFADLAPLRDPSFVVFAIARALGVREAGDRPLLDQLICYLGERHPLVVLDNFEQVLSAGAVPNALLSACPHLVLLVTSRAPLRLRAEHRFPVGPLALPAPGRPAHEEVADPAAAVALFAARARAVRPDFALTEANVAAVGELCIRLDGLPLAIELAAARSDVLAPEALLTRLKERLLPLRWEMIDVPDRHRALAASFAWSYDLLTLEEQGLFRRLGVFVGGWSVEAAAAVARPDELGLNGLEGLYALVNQSLVQVIEPPPDGEPRFRLLETVREFALEHLVARGELDEVRRRHATYFLEVAERAAPRMFGPEQRQWLRRLDRERHNLRAALDWAAEAGEAATELRLAASMGRFWWMRGYASEGQWRLEAALAHDRDVPGLPRAQALWECGLLARWQGDDGRARQLFEEALALGRALGDVRSIAEALRQLSALAAAQGDNERAAALGSEGLAAARAAADTWASGMLLLSLGVARLSQGQPDQAEPLLAESLALLRQTGEMAGLAAALAAASRVAQGRGDLTPAAAMLVEALALCRDLGSVRETYYTAVGAVGLLLRRGAPEQATRLLAALDALRESTRLTATMVEQDNFTRAVTAAQVVLGEPAFAAAWAEGRELSLAHVVDDALAALAASSPARNGPTLLEAASRSDSRLSGREREVLGLLADGFTNPQIAERLVITLHTVKFHVASLMQKLGARNRAETVALAVQQGLLEPAAVRRLSPRGPHRAASFGTKTSR